MPYVSTDITSAQEDEDQKKKDSAGESSGSPTLSGGTGTESNSPAGTPNSGAGKPSSSGSWTNLQSYLDANSDKQFGSQVAGKVQGEVDNANKSQQQAQTGFQQDVDKNTVKYDSDLTKQATDDPYAFLQDSDKVSKFTKQRDASYTGPKSLSDDADIYNNTTKAVQDAYQDANLYNNGSSGGNQALLQKLYNRPQYSGGQQNLDSLLLQNDKGARQAFAGVKDQANQSNQNFQNLQNSLQQYAGNAATTTQAAHDQTGAALTGAQNTLNGTIDARLAANQKVLDGAPQIAGDLKTGDFSKMSPEQLAAMGFAPNQVAHSWGLDLNHYFTPAPNAAVLNRNTVGTADEIQRANALSQLSGGNPLYDQKSAGMYSNPNSLLGQFDQSGFNKDVAGKSAEFQKLLNDKTFFSAPYNAAGVGNPFYRGPNVELGNNFTNGSIGSGSILDELKMDMPAAGGSYATQQNNYQDAQTKASNFQQLSDYLNSIYHPNSVLNTGGFGGVDNSDAPWLQPIGQINGQVIPNLPPTTRKVLN